MAKRRRSPESDGAAAKTPESGTVFVDTNLGSHLVTLICSSDTVSDFKKKVAKEHKHCFPKIGEIKVDSVKVKRKSNYYHLPDRMLVWTAFAGVKGNWFLSLDASNIPTRNSLELGTSSGDTNRNEILLLTLPDVAAEKNPISEMIAERKVDRPVEKTSDFMKSINLVEQYAGTESHEKKKKRRKVRHTKDGSCQYDVEGWLASEGVHLSSTAEKSNFGNILDTQNLNGVHPIGVFSVAEPGSSAGMMDACSGGGDGDVSSSKRKRNKKEVKKTAAEIKDATDMEQIGEGERINLSIDKMEEGKRLPLENDHDVIMSSKSKAPDHVDSGLALKEKSFLQDAEKKSFSNVNLHKLVDSDETKEGALESGADCKHDQDVPTLHSGGFCTDIPNLSATLMDAGGGSVDVNNDRKKRKKKKVQKTAKVKDTRDMEKIGKGEQIKTSIDEMEEGKSLLVDNDREVIIPLNGKAQNHVGSELGLKEASSLQDSENSNCFSMNSHKLLDSDKHKEEDALVSKINRQLHQDVPVVHSVNVCSNIPVPSATLMVAGGGSGDFNTDGKKRKKKKVQKTAKVENTRDMEQIGKDDMNKPHTEEKGASIEHYSKIKLPPNTKVPDHVDPDSALKEASVLREADAVIEPKISIGTKKMKKKRKEKIFCTNMENSGSAEIHNGIKGSLGLRAPSCDQQVGSESSAIKETSIDFANSQLEGRCVDSSKVLSPESEKKVDDLCKGEEKVNEVQQLVVNTDALTENSGKRGEQCGDQINFKQYFVADPLQNKVDYCDKERKTTKLKRISTRAKDNDLPAANISTELQNSIKSVENKNTENNSYRKDTEGTKCGSGYNSDLDRMGSISSKRSLKTTGKEVKDYSHSLRNAAASSFQNNNPILDKSSSGRSENLHNITGNKRPLMGRNVVNMMLMTPKKMNLLARPVAIFQDNSGESSGDENGNMHSDDSTLSPSDGSSTSGDSDSEGESELSQDSINNGLNGAPGNSKSKLNLAASKDLTMDVILRSSKRYKKAELQASQNVTEPIEMVPDSQPL